MPPKRTFYRRVNKHIKTLHCECNKSYTRADHFERHKSVCRHTSEYVAASSPLPESLPDSRPFYCSCGAGFTAADAFLRHRNRMGHDGNWEQSRYQPKGHSAASITAEPQDDLVELTGARPSDFDDSGLGSSIKGAGSDSPQGEDPVASPASDVTLDVEFSTQPEPFVNIIKTSSETTDLAVVPESLEETSFEVTLLVETSQTLQVQQSEAADIETVSLETEQTMQETQISVEVTEDVSLEIQPSAGQESEEQGTDINEDQEKDVSSVVETDSPDKDDVVMHQLPEETESLTSTKIDRTDLPTGEENEPITDNTTDDHSSPDTAVPQQDQAPTTDSSTSPAQQNPKVEKSGTQSPKSRDPLRKSKKGGISKDRSPKRKAKRSNKNFLKKHCNVLSSVIVGLLAAGYCVLSGRNMFTAATSSQEWVVDSTALQHIAKDGNSFHNKGALFEECDWASRGWSCDWSGQVQLTFDNGKKLMLEDVSYQPQARSNVVSLNKLGASGVSGYWNHNEIAVYNETSSEMVGKAVWRKSAYTLNGLVEKKTISTAPVIATPFSQSKTTSSSTISTSSKAIPTVTVKRSANPRKKSSTSSAPSSTAVSPTRSSTTTTVTTPKSTKTATVATQTPQKRPLRAATSSLDITILSATATESIHGPSPAITTGGKFASYELLKFLTETSSLPKLSTVQPAPSSSKKRSLEDATQSSSKKARTSSAVPSVTSQTAATPSSWANWWPIAVPRVHWPKGAASSANGTMPTLATPVPSASARVNAATATAEPSTGDSSSSSGTSWFGSFGSFGTKRVDPIQYTKEKLAEVKAETARKNDELKKRVSVEEKACPPCPPCLLSMPRINRGRTGIYI